MPIQGNPALTSTIGTIKAARARDVSFEVDDKTFDKLLGQLADASGAGGSVTRQLGDGALLPQEKMALIKNTMSADDVAQLKDLVGDQALMGALKPDAQNLLKAIVGLEPLAAADGVGDAQRVDTVGAVPPGPQVAAVAKMKQLVASKKLQTYYDALILPDADPALKAEAEKLFDALPKITAATKAEDMVALGLWTQAPRGIEAMEKSARYLPGRQILVKTTVNTDLTKKLDFTPIGMAQTREDGERMYFQALKKDPNGRWSNAAGERFGPDGPEKSLLKADVESFLSYDPDGVEAVTSRATLVGEEGDNFLVKIDGKEEPVSVPKQEILDLNQPQDLGDGDTVEIGWKKADFDSGMTKAKVCEAAINMDKHVKELDFTKAKTMGTGGALRMLIGGSGGEDMVELQMKCVQEIHDVIDMMYDNDGAPGRKGGDDVGRQAIKGAGVCFEQSGVMASLTVPFHKMLGIDIRTIKGGNYRSVTSSDDSPFRSGGHMWVEYTFRPSMRMTVTDRTWNQSNFPIDKAYSFFGDRYPGDIDNGFELAKPSDTDINLSGDISVQTFDRQFGTTGDGRENHQSNRGGRATRSD